MPHLPSIPAPWHAGLVGAWESARDFAAPRTPTFNERIATDHPLLAALPEIAANDRRQQREASAACAVM